MLIMCNSRIQRPNNNYKFTRNQHFVARLKQRQNILTFRGEMMNYCLQKSGFPNVYKKLSEPYKRIDIAQDISLIFVFF